MVGRICPLTFERVVGEARVKALFPDGTRPILNYRSAVPAGAEVPNVEKTAEKKR